MAIKSRIEMTPEQQRAAYLKAVRSDLKRYRLIAQSPGPHHPSVQETIEECERVLRDD